MIVLASSNCYAAVRSSVELIEKANELDSKPLSYRGELITAVMNRGEYSWINLNDGANAIGVWCKSSLLKDVGPAGDYKHEGDLLEVTGVFNRACSVHGGELDIHADTVRTILRGYPVSERIDIRRIYSSVILFALIIICAIFFRKKL